MARTSDWPLSDEMGQIVSYPPMPPRCPNMPLGSLLVADAGFYLMTFYAPPKALVKVNGKTLNKEILI